MSDELMRQSDVAINAIQEKMAELGFVVPVRVISAGVSAATCKDGLQVVPIGYRFRVLPTERRSEASNKNYAFYPWVAEWDKDTPAQNDLIQYETIYVSRSAQGAG